VRICVGKCGGRLLLWFMHGSRLPNLAQIPLLSCLCNGEENHQPLIAVGVVVSDINCDGPW
jgi:hypothetical protein